MSGIAHIVATVVLVVRLIFVPMSPYLSAIFREDPSPPPGRPVTEMPTGGVWWMQEKSAVDSVAMVGGRFEIRCTLYFGNTSSKSWKVYAPVVRFTDERGAFYRRSDGKPWDEDIGEMDILFGYFEDSQGRLVREAELTTQEETAIECVFIADYVPDTMPKLEIDVAVFSYS